MSRDAFDKKIGEMLREAETPVPEGAREAILKASRPSAPKTGLGAAAGAVAAVVLLGALAFYSQSRQGEDFTPAAEKSAKHTAEQVTLSPEPTAAETVDIEEEQRSETAADAGAAPFAEEAVEEYPDRREDMAAAHGAGSEPLEPETAPNSETSQMPESEPKAENTRNAAEEILLPESIPASAAPPSTSERASLALSTADEGGEEQVLRAAIRAENLKGFAPFEIDFEALGTFSEVEWDFGRFGTSNEVNTRRTFDRPGTYTVMLTAFDSEGKYVTDMVTVDVREGSNLVVPDSFTPNGDGINDTFKAEGVNLVSYRLTVVDSRGNTVFETRNIDQPWVYDGPQVSSELDAYFAIIQAEGIDGKTYNIRRRINIIF